MRTEDIVKYTVITTNNYSLSSNLFDVTQLSSSQNTVNSTSQLMHTSLPHSKQSNIWA